MRVWANSNQCCFYCRMWSSMLKLTSIDLLWILCGSLYSCFLKSIMLRVSFYLAWFYSESWASGLMFRHFWIELSHTQPSSSFLFHSSVTLWNTTKRRIASFAPYAYVEKGHVFVSVAETFLSKDTLQKRGQNISKYSEGGSDLSLSMDVLLISIETSYS